MGRVLILGGTRNLGHVTALKLLDAGHNVTVLNRGLTIDELPVEVERIHADRDDSGAITKGIHGRAWDTVVDTTSYTAADAEKVCALFRDKCARMVFISTGQVYLVRKDVRPPFQERDYDGPTIPEPSGNSSDYDNWRYGVEKRDAEGVFSRAANQGLSVATLRLPMIASERDHYGRIQAYLCRALDGGPILIPSSGNLPIRHVYVADVARLIGQLCTDSRPGCSAYNICGTHSISLTDFFELLRAHVPVRYVAVERTILEAENLVPTCSPYSGRWMSELDGSLSIRELGAEYTAPADYVRFIAEDYFTRWRANRIRVPGYDRRPSELRLANVK